MSEERRPRDLHQAVLAAAFILGLCGCPVVNAPPSPIRCDGADAGDCAPDPRACVCTKDYKPVCAQDGKTYGNACQARCARVSIEHDGECKQPSSACKRNDECRGTDICHPEQHRCQPECTIACLRYDPVCGEDGVTYGCGQPDAFCHGSAVAHEGECEMAGACSYGGKTYPLGASFAAEDGCNDCNCQDGGAVVCTFKLCSCDYSAASGRRWFAKSPEACKAVRFACEQGTHAFFDDCGCGCAPDASGCKVGGCSSQVCQDASAPEVVTTCEWTEAYACYRTAICEPQPDGSCGWTETDELRKCLTDAR